MGKKVTVDLDDLVTLSQYADEVGYTRQAITNWQHRYTHLKQFPDPLFTVGKTRQNRRGRRGGAKIYSRKVLDKWMTENGREMIYALENEESMPE
jgi:hypothetical protein